ncbi:hypothetical protein [Parasutterella excrementihominis]|uniref:hypothetical protein n=1 Tax=Parasutterella excrementihominis TaxID=487175 RepID=UPI00242E23A3|nr:hypothetical protein [Parasutterella excrementihominis]
MSELVGRKAPAVRLSVTAIAYLRRPTSQPQKALPKLRVIRAVFDDKALAPPLDLIVSGAEALGSIGDHKTHKDRALPPERLRQSGNRLCVGRDDCPDLGASTLSPRRITVLIQLLDKMDEFAGRSKQRRPDYTFNV